MQSIDKEKAGISAQITAQVEEYLVNGGTIYQATSADNSMVVLKATRTRKQMIDDQKKARSRSLELDKLRKAAK